MADGINSKVKTATKWSAITEITAKLVTPITSMVLARLLTPEAYGIVATLGMIIVFAEIFTDAGFQKYIIQHEFEDDVERDESINVAFWSNLCLSFILWLVIAIFSKPLMVLVGNPGYEAPLIIACISIPLAAFSSIQMAIYKREMDYKTLFKIRLIGILVPLLITIPCAFFFRNFWALLIGTISSNLINAIVLTIYSNWKPRLYYSWHQFKEMFSFTFWSMLESVSTWLVNYFDVFVIGTILNQYYLGLYKTGSSLVTQVFALITSTTSSILFASLSRSQNSKSEFESIFLKFQKYVGILVIPLGFGFLCYSDLFTSITMGDQWMEASQLIGLWGFTSSFMIVLNHYCGIAYRSLGKPKLSTLSEWLHILFLWPAVVFAAKQGFECLYYIRSLIRFQHIIVDLVIMNYVIHISARRLINNLFPSIISAFAMLFFAFAIKYICKTPLYQFLGIFACAMVYFSCLCIFRDERQLVNNFTGKIKRDLKVFHNKIVHKS